MQDKIRRWLLFVPAIAVISSAVYFMSLFSGSRTWLSVLTFTDYLDRALDFLPLLVAMLTFGVLVSLENRPRPKRDETPDEHRNRTGWGSPFGRFTEKMLDYFPWLMLVWALFVAPTERIYLLLIFIAANLFHIVMWIMGNLGMDRTEIENSGVLRSFPVLIIAGAVLGFSWAAGDHMKLTMRQFDEAESPCTESVCVESEFFVDQVSNGILTYSHGQMRLRDASSRDILIEGVFDLGSERPLICVVPGACAFGSWVLERIMAHLPSTDGEIFVPEDDDEDEVLAHNLAQPVG